MENCAQFCLLGKHRKSAGIAQPRPLHRLSYHTLDGRASAVLECGVCRLELFAAATWKKTLCRSLVEATTQRTHASSNMVVLLKLKLALDKIQVFKARFLIV